MPDLGGHPLVSTALAIAGKIAGQRRAQQSLFNAILTNRTELARFRSQPEIRFLSYAFAHRPWSRSARMEDLWVSWQLDQQRDGYFVELGADEDRSPTLLLAQEFGWAGIMSSPTLGGSPVRLTELLDQRQAPAVIDYLAIDSDGAALTILSGLDPDRYHARLITCEMRKRTTPEVEALLGRRGYVRMFPQFSLSQGWFVDAALQARPEPTVTVPAR